MLSRLNVGIWHKHARATCSPLGRASARSISTLFRGLKSSQFIFSKAVRARNLSSSPPKHSGSRLFFEITVGLVTFLVVFTLVMYIQFKRYIPRWSLVFVGEDEAYEKQMDETFGFPISKMGPRLFGISSAMILAMNQPPKEVLQLIDEFIQDYPNNGLGYALKGAYHYKTDDLLAAEKARAEAIEIAEKYPNENDSILQMLPKSLAEYSPKEHRYPATFQEVIPNRLWAYAASFGRSGRDPTFAQSSIWKQKDGTLLIINPTGFTAEYVDKINQIGPVVGLVTTTTGHGDALNEARTFWPTALCYGTDPVTKHDHREIEFQWIPHDGQWMEFQCYALEGSFTREIALYNSETKSLLGLTDMVVPAKGSPEDPPFLFGVYNLGVGLARGPTYPHQCAPVAYHYVLTAHRPALKGAIQRLLDLDISVAPLGHGGILQGPQVQEEIKAATSYLFKPDYKIGYVEQFFLSGKFLAEAGAWVTVVELLKKYRLPSK